MIRGEQTEALATRPLVLIADTAHGPRIEAVNRAGAAAGAHKGMMLADARTLCPEIATAPSDPAGDLGFLETLAIWAQRWGPWSALDAPDGLLVDVTAVPHLFGGETLLLEDVREAFARRRLAVRMAIAPTAGAAWALAHHAPDGTIVEHHDDIERALSDLPVAALRLDQDVVTVLRRLGLKRLGEIATLGRDAIQRRFRNRKSPAANPLIRRDQLLGRVPEPLLPVIAQQVPLVQRRLMEPIRHRQLLDQVVADLAQDMARELEGQGQGARRLELGLWRVDGEVVVRRLEMAAATRDPAHMLRLFAARLDDIEAGFGIEMVRLRASWAEPLALAQGDLAGAQTQYAAALELSRLLARQDTGNTELKRDLAIAFEKYGNVLQRLGDLAGAQAAYSAALAGRESLAARDPGNAQWQRDLAISHNLAGDIALALGDAAAARGAYDRALARLLPLTAANAGLGRDISITYNKIGQAALAQGDPQAAGDAFRAGLAPMRALVAQNPAHTVWQSDLAVSHDFLGLALWNSGDLSGARRAFEESLRLTTALLAQDPDNRAWQRSLAISHDRLGGLAQTGGDLAAAAASFGAARDLRAALLAANPDNLLWRQDLAYSHGNLGSVALGQGDAAAARQAFAEALTIQRDLVQRDPANARWRHDIALTLSNLARSGATPRAYLTEALAIVTALRAENQLLPLAEGWADDLETALSGLNVPE